MFQRFRFAAQRFLMGRYGNDRLNMVLFVSFFVLSILSSIVAQFSFGAVLWVVIGLRALADLCVVGFLFRFLSRNIAARQAENQWLMRSWRNLTDRKSRYFCCPKCSQTVRVPRGRGKICIRCPRCNEKFVKKS